MPSFEWCGHKGRLSARGKCASCARQGVTHGGKIGGKAWGRVKAASGKKAGTRSGVRRLTKIALVVKRPWLMKIFAGEKDWEIRGALPPCTITPRLG